MCVFFFFWSLLIFAAAGTGPVGGNSRWSASDLAVLTMNIENLKQQLGIVDLDKYIIDLGHNTAARKSTMHQLAQGIGREQFTVNRKVTQLLHERKSGHFSMEEEVLFRALMIKHGKDKDRWQTISSQMGVTPARVRDHSRTVKSLTTMLMLQAGPDVQNTPENPVTGAWTAPEEELLRKAVGRNVSDQRAKDEMSPMAPLPVVAGYKRQNDFPWTEIAKAVGTRSPQQCARKWMNGYVLWS